VELEPALQVNLRTLPEILLDRFGEATGFALVEGVAVNEHRLAVFPLPGLWVLAAGADGKAERRHAASVAERPDFRIAGESANQNHFVHISHGAGLLGGSKSTDTPVHCTL